MTTMELIGAKGGQGTTTVAVILAAALARHGPTLLVVDDVDEAAALAAAPVRPDGSSAQRLQLAPGLWAIAAVAGAANAAQDHIVVDLGRLGNGLPLCASNVRRYIVHRGPDYVAAWHHARAACSADGIILLQEPGRALRTTDLAEATRLPIAATVPVAQALARAIDAGLLLPRLDTITALAPLLALAAATEQHPAPAHRLTPPHLHPALPPPRSISTQNCRFSEAARSSVLQAVGHGGSASADYARP